MNFDIDLGEFRRALIAAMRRAFLQAQQQHADEQFYAFGLYTSGSFAYVAPTFNTEEGLARTINEYTREGYGPAPKQLAAELRWNPPDWAYHLEGKALLDAIDKTLFGMPGQLQDKYAAQDAWEQGNEFRSELERLFLGVLKQLDDEGVFGRQETRHVIVINLWMGDQSDESRLAYVVQLNPPVVCERLRAELGSVDNVVVPESWTTP